MTRNAMHAMMMSMMARYLRVQKPRADRACLASSSWCCREGLYLAVEAFQ